MEKKPFDPYHYRRKTIRLPKHDYSWTGAYFITIRAQQHEPVFEIPELHALLLETCRISQKDFLESPCMSS